MKIILYSTHCPRCNVLEKKLKSKNITYQEINDPDVITKRGIDAVPVLEIDGNLFSFKEANNWINTLEDK